MQRDGFTDEQINAYIEGRYDDIDALDGEHFMMLVAYVIDEHGATLLMLGYHRTERRLLSLWMGKLKAIIEDYTTPNGITDNTGNQTGDLRQKP